MLKLINIFPKILVKKSYIFQQNKRYAQLVEISFTSAYYNYLKVFSKYNHKIEMIFS